MSLLKCPAEERTEIPVYCGFIIVADVITIGSNSKVICNILRCHIFIIFSDMIKKLTDNADIAPYCPYMESCCHAVHTVPLH